MRNPLAFIGYSFDDCCPKRASGRPHPRATGTTARRSPFVALVAVAAAIVCSTTLATAATMETGGLHSLLLRDDGTLWAWGNNEYGQLGDGTTLSRAAPVLVMTGVKAIGAGGFHSFAIRTDDSLWAWGSNTSGQLGDGTFAERTTPVRILSDVRFATGGDGHSLAIKTDGSLWAWGSNFRGALGDGTSTWRPSPIMVMSGVRAVSAGGGHTLAVKTDGTLWAWGDNDGGRLGDGTTTTRLSPVQIMTNVRAVAAGGEHSFAVKTDGSLWAWGDNFSGQLGDGTSIDRLSPVPVLQGVQSVATSDGLLFNHALALKSDGTLWGWGGNLYGQVGDGTENERMLPVSVASGIVSMSAGRNHSLAIRADGTLLAWGDNEKGQLGVATTVSRSAPVAVLGGIRDVAGGSFHSLAIRTDNSLWTWGANATGQLGDGTLAARAAPAQVLTDVQAVAGGGFFDFAHTLALKSDGTLWAWGENLFGQLGNGDSLLEARVPLQVLSGVQSIGAGENHSLAVKTDGTLWTWGYNGEGQLGDGTKEIREAPVQVLTNVRAASGGTSNSAAIRADNSLWSWGANYAGQVGDGTTQERLTPVQVLDNVKAVAVGAYHTVALKLDGSVWTWGWNLYGELGDGTSSDRTIPLQVMTGVVAIAAGDGHSLAVKADGTLWSWGQLATPGTSGGTQPVPRQNPFLRNVVRVAAGSLHALAVTAEGRVLAWGDNSRQQLSIPHIGNSTSPVAVRDPQAPFANADLVVEYFNPTIRNGAGTPGIGHYFITAATAEMTSIDLGGSGPGWSRTGRTFRAWSSAAKAPPGAVGVCRFYARGPNSHFYTAGAAECQSLRDQNPSNDPNAGWAYEGIAFHTVLPSGNACPAGYHPVYRSYNNRFAPDPTFNDGNHRITPSYNDYLRTIRFFDAADEGVAFCSPAFPEGGGDLQATFVYPGATAQAGDPISIEFLFSNNGAGRGDGGTVYLPLAQEVADWTVTCAARNGAVCPATGDLSALREGVIVATWPAGGSLTFIARGTAPQVTAGSAATLNFSSLVVNASGSPDSTPANDTPPTAQIAVKGTAVCNAVVNPVAMQLPHDAQSPSVALVIGNGCGWSAGGGAPWVTATPTGGTGDATVMLSVAANTESAQRSAKLTIGGRTLTIAQAAAPAPSGDVCDSMRLQREGDQVAPGGLTGPQSFDVIADARCAWRARSNTGWITVTAGAGGNGNGIVSYLVESYGDLQVRTGSITVGAKTFTINQLGNPAPQGGDSGGDSGSGSSGGGSSGGGSG